MKRHRTTSGNLRKKANCILCLFVGVLLAALGNAAEVRSDEEQILKLEDDWVRALQNHDRESLDKIVAPEFTFIEPNGTIRNRQQYLADRTSHEADIKTFQNDELKVRVFGNSALASGLAKLLNTGRAGVTGLSSGGRNCGLKIRGHGRFLLRRRLR
jgi:ketosteroid isomerase-like protein